MSKLGEEDFEDKDLFTILKKDDKDLTLYSKDDFSQIYLFFDYDGHATEADDDQIEELLKLFDNETENGKLYISYPMIEAICHFRSLKEFKDLTFSCKGQNCPVKQRGECSGCKKYKQEVGEYLAPGVSNLKSDVWPTLIDAHLKKANYIIENNYVFPKQLITQLSIFENQKDKYISNDKCPQVAVLSAIPIFLLDYYGVDKIRTDVIETT